MTAFFVPGVSAGQQTVLAYEDLRTYVEATTGAPARSLRLCALNCRRQGMDLESRVGAKDPLGGGVVHGIFATRDGYVIVWSGGHAVLGKRQIYEAVEFD
jgi:hypothetical protein